MSLEIKAPTHQGESSEAVLSPHQGVTQKSRLMEHVIHAMEDADDDTMVQLIKVLEQHSSSSKPQLSSVEIDSTGIDRGDSHSMMPGDASIMPGNPDEIEVHAESPSAAAAGAGPPGGGRRRIGISAAPIQMTTVKKFVAREIEKTNDEEHLVRKGIEASSLFTQMELEATNTIVRAMEKEEHAAGVDILTQDGPSNNKFYLIADGQCTVVKNGKQVATLETGQVFGELEMMYEVTECAATVRAVTDATFFVLDKETYQNVVLQVSMEKRELYTKLLSSVGFLEDVPEYELMNIADALVPAKYASGEHIIRFGEQGNYLHFIIDGTVQIVGREMGKKKEIIQLGSGNVVGELEFLFNQSTIADVIAVTVVKTAKISRKHYEMCMGPIADQLKTFIKKGKYDYFLSSASDAVQKELSEVEKRVVGKKTTNNKGGSTAIGDVEDEGEIIFKGSELHHMSAEKGADKRSAAGEQEKLDKVLHRYPLRTVSEVTRAMMIVREDGTLLHWNREMERLTFYSQDDVAGQPIYAFMGSPGDQKFMQEAIHQAVSWAGNVEGFFESEFALAKKERLYSFGRSDGLTKVNMRLDVAPPTVAQTGGKSETLLIVGTETTKKGPNITQDHGQWFVDRVNEALSAPEAEIKGKLGMALDKWSTMQHADMTQDNLSVINLRQLVGQTTMALSAKAVERGHTINTEINATLGDEYHLDTKLLPDAMKYAMNNAVSHTWNVTITIKVDMVTDVGVEYLQFTFHDTAGLLPDSFARKLKEKNPENPSRSQKVSAALTSIGGTMTCRTKKKQFSEVVFRVPFIPYEDDEEEDVDEASMMAQSTTSSLTKSFGNLAPKKRTFTTLVFEERPNHKHTLCSLLWERKHAVVPGTKWSDVEKVLDSADILVIDPQQTGALDLQKYVRDIAIIVTGDNFEEKQKKAYASAGFFTLTKPFSAGSVLAVLRQAEAKVAKVKAASEQIERTRETFKKTKKGEWKKGRMLGKGAFGEVFEAIDILTKGKMAVKQINVSPKLNKAELMNEINVMCDLQHKNIIHYFSCEEIEEENKINVFMEFAEGGTLAGMMKGKEGGLEMKDIVWAIRDTLDGIIYTHQERFVHCDLKTDNILLNNGVCKIGDFGTAKRLTEEGSGSKLWIMQGTPMYMAPEVMGADEEEGVGYDFSADIWSFGVIVMEMATNKPPWAHIQQCQSSLGLIRYVTELTDTPDLSPLFDKHPAIIEFVSACLRIEPSKRPTATELAEFSLLKEGDEDMASALKALQRAQLWHMLSQFTAFQDEEEIEAERKKKEEDLQKKKGQGRRESAFFDSDEDESEDGGFFDETDDDDDAVSMRSSRTNNTSTSGTPQDDGFGPIKPPAGYVPKSEVPDTGGAVAILHVDNNPPKRGTLGPESLSQVHSGSLNTVPSRAGTNSELGDSRNSGGTVAAVVGNSSSGSGSTTLVPHPPSNGGIVSPPARRAVSFGEGAASNKNSLQDVLSSLTQELTRLGLTTLLEDKEPSAATEGSETSRNKSNEGASKEGSSETSADPDRDLLTRIVEELKKKEK